MNPRKRFLVFAILFQINIFLAGSLIIRGEFRFDSWTTDDGLPQNSVREIAQTPDGYLWFTTFDGLVRFDGVKFTSFSKGDTSGIINNRFTGIYCDKDGALYAMTTEGGVFTVYKNGAFTSYTNEQVPGVYIESIKPDENGEMSILVVEGNHKSRSRYTFRDGQFILVERIDKDNPTEYKGASGATWHLSADKIVETRNGKRTIYNFKIERFNGIREVFEDGEGALWISGAKLVRLKDSKITDYTDKENFPLNSDFHSFWEEKDGSVWFANGGRSAPGLGLVRYKDGKFSSFGKEFGLSNTSIFSVFRDRESTIWLATNKGLNRFRDQVIQTYSVKDGLRNAEVYPIYRDRKDNIWIGTVEGLNIYRNGKFELVNLQQSDPNASEVTKWRNGEVSVQSLWEDANEKMWIGVNGGLYVAENGATKMFPETAGHHVYAVLGDDDKGGDVWAATDKGIFLFRNYKRAAFYTTDDGLPDNFINVIFKDSKGRLWFGGYGGLSEFRDGKFINYTTANGLVGNYVRSIYEDADGVLWIGTYGEGLSRFKNDRFFNYKTEDGLFSNDVFAVREDAGGNFWISSNHGIYRVKRQDLNDYADGKIEKITSISYGKEDGMLNNECNGGRQPASITDADGNFWFPTQDGIAVINPQIEKHNRLSPPVIIESVFIERDQVAAAEELFIEAGKQNIEINFTAVSLIKSEQIKFKYKLENHDKDWIDAGTRRTAHYSHLPPGNYRFYVKAANSDGVWNETGASLAVKMQPFFYQTAGFYYLCIAVGILTLFVVWKISVNQLESRERKLARLVAQKTEALRKANEELRHLANSDGLTLVGNRRSFQEFLSNEWQRAVRSKTEISLILLDIDHFKLFNDTYGHHAGDECLKKVAAALRRTIHRPTDFVARFGGEEFAIILGGTNAEGAFSVAERILENVKDLNISHTTSKTCAQLTVSVGVATTFADLETSESELIKSADKALYEAKENGRNQIMTSGVSYAFVNAAVLEEEFVA